MRQTFKVVFFISMLSLGGCFTIGTIYAAPRSDLEEVREDLKARKKEVEEALIEYRAATEAEKLEALRSYGLAIIEQRFISLAQLEDRMDYTECLSEDIWEEIFDDIDSTVVGLQGLRDKIEAEDDIEGMKELIKAIFYDFRVYIVKIPRNEGLRATGVMECVIRESLNPAINELENAIQELEDAGEDVSYLESLLEQLKQELDSTETNIDKAQDEFRAMQPAQDVTEATAHLQQGKQYLIAAKDDLAEVRETVMEMIEEFKKFAEGEAVLEGSGTLTANGEGMAYIEGDGEVILSGENGVLIVTDNNGDAVITVEGFGNKTELAPGRWKYTGSGSAVISGSDIAVELEGVNLDLTASGTGVAILTGTGELEVCRAGQCDSALWSAEGIRVKLVEE